jgi:hypothetical protein
MTSTEMLSIFWFNEWNRYLGLARESNSYYAHAY